MIGKVAATVLALAAVAAGAQTWRAELGKMEEEVPAGVLFLTNDKLLAYAVERPRGVGLRSRAETLGPDTPRLRTFVLDAASGRVLEKHDLPAPGYQVLRVMPTAAGGFFVRVQKAITLYGADFREKGRRELPHGAGRDFWVSKVSPSGRTLWLYHEQTHTVERFDAATFQPLSACSGVTMTEFASVSDDKFLQEARQSYVVRNAACETAAFPKIAGKKGRRAPMQCGMAHPLLGEGTVAMAGCGQVTFATLYGQVVGEDYFGWKNQVGVFPEVARGQGAVAFWVFQPKGSLSSFFGSGGTAEVRKSEIRVYDAEKSALAGVAPLGTTRPRGFAVSPDGKSVAVLRGSAVEVYRVAELSK